MTSMCPVKTGLRAALFLAPLILSGCWEGAAYIFMGLGGNDRPRVRWSPLHYPVLTADVPKVSRLLERRPRLARARLRRGGRLPLELVADSEEGKFAGGRHGPEGRHQRRLQIADLLVKHGADVNADDGAALRRAAGRGDLDMVRLLVGHGADVNAPEDSGDALSAAAGSGNAAIVRLMLEKGARPSAAALVGAAGAGDGHGSKEVTDILIAAGAKPNGTDAAGITPLLRAARARNVEIVRALLAAGADPNFSRGQIGSTALHVAAGTLRADIAGLLIEAGADPNARDRDGRTPLARAPHTSKPGQSEAIVRLLVEAGAELEGTRDGMEAVVFFARQGNLGAVEFLVEKGSRSVSYGLVSAAACEDHRAALRVARFLIGRGADVHMRQYGRTALHAASRAGNVPLVEALLAKGAKPDAKATSSSAMTALHVAAAEGRAEVARVLIGAGADKEAEDERGRMPVDWARRGKTEGHRRVEALLR